PKPGHFSEIPVVSGPRRSLSRLEAPGTTGSSLPTRTGQEQVRKERIMLFSRGKKLTAVLLALGLSAGAAGALASPGHRPRPAAAADGRLIVREWGTFLSVQGSDGGTLGGMVDSEERLPIFVRERTLDGGNRACWFQKMETPVTYFYVDRPRTVRVRVDM